jgi:hypothetical protein
MVPVEIEQDNRLGIVLLPHNGPLDKRVAIIVKDKHHWPLTPVGHALPERRLGPSSVELEHVAHLLER